MDFLISLFIKDYKNINDFKVRNKYGLLVSIVGIILNVWLFLTKFFVGTLANSVSIVADSFNNLSDSSSSIITFIGFKLSGKPADEDHPYGHGRYEYFSGLIVAILIAFIGFELLKSSFDKIIHPTPLHLSLISFIVLVLSILIKSYMLYYNLKIGKKINSKSLIATASDSRNDCITTLAVLFSNLISIVFDINIDGITGLLVAIFILYSSFSLIKDTLNPLLGNKPSAETVKSLYSKITEHDNVYGVHDLIIHDYGPGHQFASAHVEIDAKLDVLEAHDIIDDIENKIFRETNIQLVVHYDPILTDDGIVNYIRSTIKDVVKSIDENLLIDNLRVINGISHTNIVFDLALQHNQKKKQTEIINEIKSQVSKINPTYNCIINVKHSYV